MAKRAGLVVVTRGDGWLLAWPRERWDVLTPAQQQDVIAAQVALMSQNVAQNRTRRDVRAQTSAGAQAYQVAGDRQSPPLATSEPSA